MADERSASNLATTIVDGGHAAAADLDHALAARRERPDDAEAWARLGLAYIAARQTLEAPRCFERAIELEPKNAWHPARLGKLLLGLGKLDSAEAALRRACALAPTSTQYLWLLGYTLREQNDIDGAMAAFATGCQIDPGGLHCAVAEALLLPPIYRDVEDVRRWRSRFEAGLERLRREQSRHLRWCSQVLTLEWENFYLAYQGGDDLPLQAGYSEFLATLLGQAVPALQAPLAQPLVRDRKIRVGFLSGEWRTCTIGSYFGSWIFGLPRERFEVWGYFTGHRPDDLTARLAASCNRFRILEAGIAAQAAVVRSDALDILVLPDVGMHTQSNLFANLRLAPIQCAGWGHPVTTGSRFIEHFISCAAMEPPDAAAHYGEGLVLLPGLGVCYEPPSPAEALRRADFGFAEDAHVYVCPNRLHKILPDHDSLFLDILAADLRAVLVFFAAVSPGQQRAFLGRLQRGMAAAGIPPRRQVKLLPNLPRARFRSALAVADVMLDTPNFSGGSTALDALAAGLPIVALEGRCMRGRQSAAMLRMVGVPELIVQDGPQYVELALRIGRDGDYRRSLAERIAHGLPRLFGRDEPVAALAGALVEILR